MKKESENFIGRRLFFEERAKLIIAELGSGAKSLDELSDSLKVSKATVRRDLLELESRGVIRRVHGGAMRLDILHGEPVFTEKKLIKEEEKKIIAEKAFDLVENGDSVYLDSGSTVLSLCRLLNKRRNLSIVTNSLMAAFELMDSGHSLYVVGGKFRPLSRALVGAMTEKTISNMNFNKAFLGTIGFDHNGISTTDPDEAYTKELVMKRAGTVILLVDSSKVGKSSLALSGDLSDIDIVVSDKNFPSDFGNFLKKKKIRLII